MLIKITDKNCRILSSDQGSVIADPLDTNIRYKRRISGAKNT